MIMSKILEYYSMSHSVNGNIIEMRFIYKETKEEYKFLLNSREVFDFINNLEPKDISSKELLNMISTLKAGIRNSKINKII